MDSVCPTPPPLTIVRGEGAYLYDEHGRAYLDCVNNVCHVGHCHPRVVAAGREQMARLNTNTRYLYPELTEYLSALTAKFPDPLKVVYLVCSGSEAVDLALRLARTATGAQDVIALESAYHGHTQSVIDVSSYKFDGSGGRGAPPTTHVVPMPCTYRGRHRGDESDPGAAYAQYVQQAVEGLAEARTQAGGLPVRIDPGRGRPDLLAGGVSAARLRCGARGRWALPCGRSPGRLRARGLPRLGLSALRCRARHRDARETDREWTPHGGGGHHS